jgi:hypothetical protein
MPRIAVSAFLEQTFFLIGDPAYIDVQIVSFGLSRLAATAVPSRAKDGPVPVIGASVKILSQPVDERALG